VTSTEALEFELNAAIERATRATNGAACLLALDAPGHDVALRLAGGGLTRVGRIPARPDTPFRIASITKSFTAVAVLQQASEERVSIDDPVVEHLPQDLHELVHRLHVLGGTSYGHRMTVRQLLTHSSGLFDYASCDQFHSAIAAEPGRPWTPRQLLQGAAEWGAPHFAPGEGYGYAYSDTGYVLLGLLIQQLDGVPLHEAFRQRILDPLGMSATYLEGYEEHRGPEMAHTYLGELDTSPIHGSADWAGGGLVSTSDDLVTFGHALLDDRLLDAHWRQVLFDHEFRSLDPDLHTPGYIGYGCGLDARLSNGHLLRGHRGHWGALLHIEPASGLVISGSVNDAARRPDDLFHEVVAIADRHGLLIPAATERSEP
jgi:D-alanyl-D-alanine carboxypeptidase